jgi:drug/metabolite transporter (DMT)-like permease
MPLSEKRNHTTGLALVALAAIAWSTGGMFIRVITANLMIMLFWRGIFSGAAVMVLFVLIERGHALDVLRAFRWPSLAVTFFSATGMITGVAAIRYTTVADAMVIYATVPFLTAGLAYVFIGEKPGRSTLVASGVALCGVAVMLWGSEWGGSLFGKGLAVLMALSMASFTTVMRRHKEVPMLPAMGASAWLCAVFAAFFASPMQVSARDLGLSALYGVFQNAVGLALYTFGSKRVPAAEATLIAALEVPLTPFWVWLLLEEVPSMQTMAGGALVLAALFGHIIAQFRVSPNEAEAFHVST